MVFILWRRHQNELEQTLPRLQRQPEEVQALRQAASGQCRQRPRQELALCGYWTDSVASQDKKRPGSQPCPFAHSESNDGGRMNSAIHADFTQFPFLFFYYLL
jgi:hypothetical protein